MRVLITGASGQVGRAMAAAVPAGVALIAASHQELDISRAESVDEFVSRQQPDIIVNAAAYTAVDRAESEPELAKLGNETGPANLARAAASRGVRLIHISTDFVFDGAASSPYPSDAPTAPLSVYGRTKRAGELAVLALLPKAGVVIRTAWVYTAQGHNFVRTMVRLMNERHSVRVVADQIGSPTSANSLARALWQAAARPALAGVYHWTDGGVASWYDLAVAVMEEGKMRQLVPQDAQVEAITTADYPTPARRPPYGLLDKTAAIAALGIRPAHWRDELRKVMDELAHA